MSPRAADVEAISAARADHALIQGIRRAAHRIEGREADYDALVAKLSGKRFVLLGEDTHGSEQTYRERSRIALRLVEQLGFDGVVIESDFTSVERVARYINLTGDDNSASAALADHRRFPRWMWMNRPFAEFVDGLRRHNAGSGQPVQIFGMDLHGLDQASLALKRSVAQLWPEQEAPFADAMHCLATFSFQADRYRYALSRGNAESCERSTTQAATLLDHWAAGAGDKLTAPARFSLASNLQLVIDSEAYSRLQIKSQLDAWNLRDRHLADAVDAAAGEIERRTGHPARLAIWAHNTHAADARATDRGRRSGYLSLGQILRERHPQETYIVGFSTRLGHIRAAPLWGQTDRIYALRRPAWESVPAILGRANLPEFLLLFDETDDSLRPLDQNIPSRAIGVVYWPHRERSEHYFRGDLRSMYDAIVHIDQTQALERDSRTWAVRRPPLGAGAAWRDSE